MFNMLNKYFYIGFSEATIKYLYMHLFYAHMNQISKYSRYKHSEIFCIIIKYLLASIFMYSKIQIYCIVYIHIIHPNIVQACIKYLLMSDSRNHMLDRFKKEFEGIWPRWRWCWWWWTRCICLHNLICICLHNSICICISGAYPNTSTGGKQWTVTEGEMVGCIIGLSPLSATKLLLYLYLYFYCIY